MSVIKPITLLVLVAAVDSFCWSLARPTIDYPNTRRRRAAVPIRNRVAAPNQFRGGAYWHRSHIACRDQVDPRHVELALGWIETLHLAESHRLNRTHARQSPNSYAHS